MSTHYNTLRKPLIIFLAFALAITLVPFAPAYAEEVEEAESLQYTDPPVSATDASNELDLTLEEVLAGAGATDTEEEFSTRAVVSKTSFKKIITYAEQYKGTRYLWGGKKPPRFDCSGLVCWVYNNVCKIGINSNWTNAASLYSDWCFPVTKAQAIPGDLVFFKGTYGSNKNYITHVGIYCGNDTMYDAGDPIGYHSIKNIGSGAPVFGRVKGVDLGVTLNFNDVQVQLDDQPYTGTERFPAVLTYKGHPMKEGMDYTISYANNTKVGTASVTIKPLGIFKGSTKNLTFKIYKSNYRYGLSDVDWNAWYGPYVDYVVKNKCMMGYSSGPWFGPDDPITRGQVATLLYRYANPKSNATTVTSAYESNTSGFSDNASGQFYTAAINWTKQMGIMTGDGSTGYTTVRPNDNISREELGTMFARLAKTMFSIDTSKASDKAFKKTTDYKKVGAWAKPSLIWTSAHGVLAGIENKNGSKVTFTLAPQQNATRAETAKMFTVLVRDVAKK